MCLSSACLRSIFRMAASVHHFKHGNFPESYTATNECKCMIITQTAQTIKLICSIQMTKKVISTINLRAINATWYKKITICGCCQTSYGTLVSRELANCLPVVIVAKVNGITFIYEMKYDINPTTNWQNGY